MVAPAKACMSDVLTPESDGEAARMIRAACADGVKLDIHGGDTRSGLGRPRSAERGISSAALEGVVFYEPAEMTICVRAGTTIEAVEAAIAEHNHILPFEPMRPQALWGARGEPTIGGMVATNHSGPRRSAGGVRDGVLGLRLVNGLGEAIRLRRPGHEERDRTRSDQAELRRSWHARFPDRGDDQARPQTRTRADAGDPRVGEKRAIDAMTRALGSPFGISAAAWLPAGMGADHARVLLRIEGFDSVAYRAARLTELLATELLAEFGEKIQPLTEAELLGAVARHSRCEVHCRTARQRRLAGQPCAV